MPDPTLTTRRPPLGLAALAPFEHAVFRVLWLTWLMANVSMWMNDVAAAWLMTSLAPSPVWVALVQTAATLPVFLLGLPSGALADTLDRRRYFLGTQVWIALVALTICTVVLLDAMTPSLLLALVFANGIGLAMRWPVFAAIVPELVPRQQLPQALALNGVSMNASRIIGPLLAGAIIAALGSAWVFLLNAVLACVSAVIIWRWKREHTPSPLGREPFFSALRVGWQYVAQSPRLRVVYLHIALFFFHSTALMALLPLLALRMEGGNAATFTLLLATMGSGAIVSAMLLPRLRQNVTRDTVVWWGSALQALAMALVAFLPSLVWSVPAMFLAGMAWIATANSLSVSAQMSLPDWVRARGMSVYQMAIMGGAAAGAAFWGQVASWTDVHWSVGIAALSGITAVTLAQRWFKERGLIEDLTPAKAWSPPTADSTPPPGRIVVCIHYHIDPARADDFRALMQESRRSRLRMGALGWELWQDIGDPGHFVECITDENWNEHLRRFDRVTASDVALRERKLAFHLGETPPVVTRYVV
ncbi:MFS transporter [Tepidicella baoligensis]|uniref:MFS transporter n=1 Tax=Tepidicella baoligensis TaxID=2707016 RepID=UPI0015DA7EA7|nr:MFS transporter [Tepidicella baoligensis]